MPLLVDANYHIGLVLFERTVSFIVSELHRKNRSIWYGKPRQSTNDRAINELKATIRTVPIRGIVLYSKREYMCSNIRNSAATTFLHDIVAASLIIF